MDIRIKRQAALAVSFIAGLLLFWAPAQAAPNYPPLTGRVVDAAGVLPADVEQALAARSEALERKTTDQFVVVTVPSLQGYSIEAFSLGLGNAWRLGQAGKNNGVLLVVAPNERKVRIEPGSGLEAVLDRETSEAILQEKILPQFRKGALPQGVSAGANAIVDRLEAAPQAASAPAGALALAAPVAAKPAPPPPTSSKGTALDGAIGLAVVCFGLFLAYKALAGIGRFIGSAMRPNDVGTVSPAGYSPDLQPGANPQAGYGFSRFAQPALAFGAGAVAGALAHRAMSGGRPGNGNGAAFAAAPAPPPSVSSAGSISPGGGGFGESRSSRSSGGGLFGGGGGGSFGGGGGSFGGGGGASGSW